MINEFLQNFKQINDGDNQGTIWATKNIDPESNHGKINVSKVLGYKTNTDTQSTLTTPIYGFAQGFDYSRYFAVGSGKCWESTTMFPNSAWTAMASTPTDTDHNSDVITFNQKMYFATQNFLKSYTGNYGAGTFANVTALANSPHSMCIYANKLYITDNFENIYSMTTGESVSKTGSATLDIASTLGTNQVITKIASVSNGIWVSTLYSDRAGGEMLFWDGATENAVNNRYIVPSGVYAMTIKDDRPYIVDARGTLRVFDGSTFIEIAKLPFEKEYLSYASLIGNRRLIHPNGMIVVEDEIYMLVGNKPLNFDALDIDQLPAGVWAWNKDYGLYHKYSFTATDITNSTLTDYGAFDLASVGALWKSNGVQGNSNIQLSDESEIFAGIQYYSDATSTKAAIGITNVQNTIQKAGYLVTVEANASLFDEQWKEVVALYDRLKNSTDRIIVKVRTKTDTPIYGTGTWSNDTLIRSSTDLSTVVVGDEIEVLRGTGAGACYDIDKITNPNDYRIQLDTNPLSGMTGTLKYRITNWKKVGTEDATDATALRKTIDEIGSAWLQIKIYLIGTGKSPQLIKLLSSSDNKESLK